MQSISFDLGMDKEIQLTVPQGPVGRVLNYIVAPKWLVVYEKYVGGHLKARSVHLYRFKWLAKFWAYFAAFWVAVNEAERLARYAGHTNGWTKEHVVLIPISATREGVADPEGLDRLSDHMHGEMYR